MIRLLANLVLLVLAGEGVGVSVYHARTGRGLGPADMAGSLGAGLMLVLAVREAGGEQRVGRIAPLLALAGVAHLVDLRGRWRVAAKQGG